MSSRTKQANHTAVAALAAAFTLGFSLSGSGVAAAATTVGQTLNPNSYCGPNTTFAQVAMSTGSNVYVAPSDGVLTSWSFMGGRSSTQDELKVVRPTGTASEYTVIGESSLETMTAGVMNTFPIRIPIKAGDVVALYDGPDTTGLDVPCSHVTKDSSDQDDFVEADPAPGTTYQGTRETASQFDVSAQLEPDADNDGYGDETQDGCPTDPTTHDGCQADLSLTKTADKASANVGANITYTLTVKNDSPYNTAHSVSVHDTLPATVSFVSATASQGSCSGAVDCTLGDLAKGATATVTIVGRVTAAGSATNSASTQSATPDPDPSNNSASATVVGVNPAAPSCVDTRKFTFKLHKWHKTRIVDAVVFINNKQAGHRQGHDLKSITIAKLPQQVFVVRIISTQATGSKLISTRTYNGCIKSRPKTTGFHIHPHHR